MMMMLMSRKSRFMACLLLLVDCAFTSAIVARVPYTKIDWDAYMSQVAGFRAGERNYANLRGDTGPLVYPAGFLYIYTAIAYVTGGDVFAGQVIFVLLYILNLGIVLLIYTRADVVPWWALCLLCLSKRVHSIFVLRLFNDCIALILVHVALAFFQSNKWNAGMIFFSVAVSVKMNILLYAPALLLLMLKGMPFKGVVTAVSTAALVQILLGLPFLMSYPMEYITRAFNLGRVFIHFWSVNFKFVPVELFVSKEFAMILLAIHLSLLLIFAQYKWCRHEGGILSALGLHTLFCGDKTNCSQDVISSAESLRSCHSGPRMLAAEHVTSLLFSGNFIGILCARSLHYQFYCWYFYSLPFLLWKTSFPIPIRLLIFGVVEMCWNIYPSNDVSSLVLLVCHVALLLGIWLASPEYPYVKKEGTLRKIE